MPSENTGKRKRSTMVNILAIDPGTYKSGWAVVGDGNSVTQFGKRDNKEILDGLRHGLYGWHTANMVVIEMMTSYGKPVGGEVFETLVWIGRFLEGAGHQPATRITRREVKNHICRGHRKKNDSQVRACLIERYGPDANDAIGTKKKPGPLHGVTGDVWAALAVGVAYREIYLIDKSSGLNEN